MYAKKRRDKIIKMLNEADSPLSASSLASATKVSRQVIVGDIALLRAAGEHILATPRGYVLQNDSTDTSDYPYIGVLACKHDDANLLSELYSIVDLGGTVIDVTIEHSVYGQLSGILDIHSRRDADLFFEQVTTSNGKPLSALTDGIHLHRIGCRDEETFALIKEDLSSKGLLYIG